jgi:hypothetical protein
MLRNVLVFSLNTFAFVASFISLASLASTNTAKVVKFQCTSIGF